MQYKQVAGYFITFALCFPNISNAASYEELTDAFKNGTPSVKFRLRHEHAKQGTLQDASASTLRSTLGYETAEFSKSTIKLEIIDVANFFGTKYNPGASDLNRPKYAMIADPKGAGLAEANLNIKSIDKNSIKIGRQYINLDNRRFIAKNNLRQFPQSYDAITINNHTLDSLNLFYGFLTHVNTNTSNGRANGARRSLSTHLLNMRWEGYQYGHITGYAYTNKDKTIKTNSHLILGLKLHADEAQTDSFSYIAELAKQQGRFGNPSKYTAYYAHGEIGKTIDLFKAAIGIERLSGNARETNRAFITPLGDHGKFNGLAQAFPSTPSYGLHDYYSSIGLKHQDLSADLTYHYFLLEKKPGAKGAGNEFDLRLHYNFNQQFSFTTAYASYNPKNQAAPKTRRFWAMLSAKII